jgi:hypothetical protein
MPRPMFPPVTQDGSVLTPVRLFTDVVLTAAAGASVPRMWRVMRARVEVTLAGQPA